MSKAYYWDGLTNNSCVFPIKCFGLGFRGNLNKFCSLGEGHAAMTQIWLSSLEQNSTYVDLLG